MTLQIRNAGFRRKDSETFFFSGINLELEEGKLHFLSGPNGSGKSSFLKLLLGQLENVAEIQGEVCSSAGVTTLEHAAKQGFASAVSQNFDEMLAANLSFRENLALAKIRGHASPFRGLGSQQRLPEFIHRFGIRPEQTVASLSGGQRQILAVLMALSNEPKILLLDEATAALDVDNARRLFSFLQDMQITVLAVCHDPGLVEEFCNGQHVLLESLTSPARRAEQSFQYRQTGVSSLAP